MHCALGTPSGTMAAPPMGPRTLADALKLGSSDLRFTLGRNDVPDTVQAHFFENGVVTGRRRGDEEGRSRQLT